VVDERPYKAKKNIHPLLELGENHP
jgi:hypothetical protein